MLPEEMEVVQDVFDAIVAEPWFHRTLLNKDEFAEFVFQAFRQGITDRGRLFIYCCEAAALQSSRQA